MKHDFYTLMRKPAIAVKKPMVDPLALHIRDEADGSYATWVIATPKKEHAEELKEFLQTYQQVHGNMPALDLTWENDALELNWDLVPPKRAFQTATKPKYTKRAVEFQLRGWSSDALHRFCSYHWMNIIVMELGESPSVSLVEIEQSPQSVVMRLQEMMRT